MRRITLCYENVKSVVTNLAAGKDMQETFVRFVSEQVDGKQIDSIVIQDHWGQKNYLIADHCNGEFRVDGKVVPAVTIEHYDMFNDFPNHEHAYRSIEDKSWKDTYEYIEMVSVDQEYGDDYRDYYATEIVHRYNTKTNRYTHTQPISHSYRGWVHGKID